MSNKSNNARHSTYFQHAGLHIKIEIKNFKKLSEYIH